MQEIAPDVGIYEIIKDIIIPLLGVLSTIVIGVYIAIILKRKEEKTKVKSLLIDKYMEYLSKKNGFGENGLDTLKHKIFEHIYYNYSDHFGVNSNRHIPMELILQRRNNLKIKLQNLDQESINWSPLTFQFAFLLGKKRYMKDAQSFEDNIEKKIISEIPQEKLFEKLKDLIRNDKEVSKGINSLNTYEIENSLDKIEYLISVNYDNFQLSAFKPYENKIADLIDKY